MWLSLLILKPAKESQQPIALVGVQYPITVTVDEAKRLSNPFAQAARQLRRQILDVNAVVEECLQVLNRDLPLEGLSIFRRRQGYCEKRQRHFVRRLFPPFHTNWRMSGIARVIFGVVVRVLEIHSRILRQGYRFFITVGSLPVEIPILDPDQRNG